MPVRYIDLADVFGAENVVRVAAADLAGLDLPPEAVRVLTEVGLPRKISDGAFIAEPLVRVGQRVQFGRTFIGFFWLDVTNGEIRISPAEGRHEPALAASTMETFVECHTRLEILGRNKPHDYSRDPQRWANFVEDELRQVDPRSVEPGAYFSFIVDNIRDLLA
jgi:hypothetical protein